MRERLSLTLKPFGNNFRLYLLAVVVFTLGNASDAFLLVRAAELGVPTALLPLLWGAFHVIKSGSNLLAGRAVDRFGSRPLLFVGWTAYAAVYVAFALADSAWQIWVVFLAYGFSFALTEPAGKTLATVVTGPEWRGLAFGWFNFSVGIAALPASLIFGWLYEQFGAPAAFSWGAALAMIAAMLLLAVRTDTGREHCCRSAKSLRSDSQHLSSANPVDLPRLQRAFRPTCRPDQVG